jgi:hypothetical protein
MKPNNVKPGTIYCWTNTYDGSYIDLYLGLENNMMIVAASNHSIIIDKKFCWDDLSYDDAYEVLSLRDLPLFMNLHTGETFLQLMQGKKI